MPNEEEEKKSMNDETLINKNPEVPLKYRMKRPEEFEKEKEEKRLKKLEKMRIEEEMRKKLPPVIKAEKKKGQAKEWKNMVKDLSNAAE